MPAADYHNRVFTVLDPEATPLMARRAHRATEISERLFMLITLGDDRAIAATHVMGEKAYERK